MLIDLLFSWVGVIIVLLIILPQVVKICREYERGVIFRLGRFAGIRGPGLFLIIPFIDKMIKLDLRVVTLDVPAQEVITKDNIPITVDAVLYFKVSDPQKATIEVEIPEGMQRAIAKQAEAERMKRAKIILAEGEYLAATKLKEAGEILKADPIVLRYLETLAEAEKNTTILFPVEMLGMLKKLQKLE